MEIMRLGCHSGGGDVRVCGEIGRFVEIVDGRNDRDTSLLLERESQSLE